MINPQIQLAQLAFDWQSKPLSNNTVWASRRALLDWFATTLPGTKLPPSTLLCAALSDDYASGGAVCYVDGSRTNPRTAALINAAASHTVEFDDIFKDGGYHPGSPTVSAALAVAQHRQTSLELFHRSLIAGYEVGARVALAIQPSHYRYWHTTSTVGTIGAAVSVATLLGCSSEQLSHAIGLATSFAGGHQQNLLGEGMAKALHPGHAAEAGILAAMAASKGVTASLQSLDAGSGFAAATSLSTGDWRQAFEGLGEWLAIERMTVKNHGCCGHIFPALDGLALMLQRHDVRKEDIQAVQVYGYQATKSMCDRPRPESAQEARFSLQYCLASLLILGRVRLDAFSPEALARQDIREYMQKVSVELDEGIASEYPAKRMARILVTLKDGRSFEHFQKSRKGDPENPLSDQELLEKFDELVEPFLTSNAAFALKHAVLFGSELPGAIPLQ